MERNSVSSDMHKEMHSVFLSFEPKLDDLEIGQNLGQSETRGSMEMVPRVIEGICFVF